MKHTLALLAFSLSLTIPASAASDYYLITPLAGPSGCGAQITLAGKTFYGDEIASFAFSGTEPSSTSGGNASNVLSLSKFVISKTFDNCSAPEMTSFLTGATLPTFTIYVRKAGTPATTPPYLAITLKSVIISQYSLVSAFEAPTEQLTLSFKEIGITAVKQGTVTAAGYNVETKMWETYTADPLVKDDPLNH